MRFNAVIQQSTTLLLEVVSGNVMQEYTLERIAMDGLIGRSVHGGGKFVGQGWAVGRRLLHNTGCRLAERSPSSRRRPRWRASL